MGALPGHSNRTLVITVVIGVIILHAALFTAMAFRDTPPATRTPPSLPAGLEKIPGVQPNPRAAAPAAPQPVRPNPEPLRVNPPGPVGMATDSSLPAAKGLTGGGKALDRTD